MVDIQLLRDDPEKVQQKALEKGYEVDVKQILGFDEEKRKLQSEVQSLRQKRNELAGSNKGQAPAPDQVKQGKEIKDKLLDLEHRLTSIELEMDDLLSKVPNMPRDDVPVGKSEADNVVTKTWGDKPQFDFKPKSHLQIGEAKGWIDRERAVKIAGSRFLYIKGDLALLEFALWQFALSVLTSEDTLKKIIADNNLNVSSKPFEFVLPPAVAKKAVYEATGRLDKEEQTYNIEGEDLWLNASAEHTLAPMYLDEILDEKKLPLRYAGYTTAFRREAGSYGKDLEGMMRLHQFNKMEMESFTTKDTSYDEHKFLIAIQEYLMQQLGLPYQVVNKCTADIGFPNASGYDIDVWLPAQDRYRETHTADNITDFQARSMKTRVKRSEGKVELAHTNDATAFSERPLIAIIENFQTKDGNVNVPEVLKPYMFGRETI
ncbi:MAG TPA: serine--tRNA ligase [Candidatus Sulfotelmatobacter sp.]|nr:serine--tRNA ligase [Candidatus Sulfotelmatobacter sp.]